MSDRYRLSSKSLSKECNLSIIIIICISALLSGCRRDSTRWGGKIEKTNGIVVVQNPSAPIKHNAVLTLIEELSIGREVGEEVNLFSDISGFDVDSEGNIYVINRPDANVCVFDMNGLFIKTIGRKGQGPGEMQMPVFLQIGADREILVVDYSGRRVLYFSMDGTFERQQPILQYFLPIMRDSKGNFIGRESFAPPPLGGSVIRAYDADFRPLFEIASEEQGTRGTFDIGKPVCYCVVRPDDTIVWGDSREYVLNYLDSEGRQIRKVTKPYDPIPLSGEYRNSMRERYADPLRAGMKIVFRSHLPAFSGIFADDTGRILVKTYERIESEKDTFYFDVFDSEGRFYAKVPIKVNLDRYSVWKNGKLYTHEMEPEGYPIIKRFKVIWDEEMR